MNSQANGAAWPLQGLFPLKFKRWILIFNLVFAAQFKQAVVVTPWITDKKFYTIHSIHKSKDKTYKSFLIIVVIISDSIVAVVVVSVSWSN